MAILFEPARRKHNLTTNSMKARIVFHLYIVGRHINLTVLQIRFFMKLVWLLLIVCSPGVVYAQRNKADASSRAPCEGGVLNRKVAFESKPVYPIAARNARAEGNVVVRVRVDEEGNIFEAIACSGH